VWTHFLGAIVLDQETTAPGQIPRFVVIDGQQRLTTLQILIAATAKAMEAAGASTSSQLMAQLAVNNPLKAKGPELLKVFPTNADRRAFAARMDPSGPPPGWADDPDNQIDEAFDFFQARATEYLTGGVDGTAGDAAERASLLQVTLCELLKVVSITLDADDNPQVIFETLNARGTPLLALDLVKNAVFAAAARQDADTDSLYFDVWQPELDDEYWREDRRQGRLFRPIGELFLMHWLTMKLERVIPATELFATFRQSILTPQTNAEGLIRELCADAGVMRSLDTPAPGTPEHTFLTRLEKIDAGTVYPLVLLLFRSDEVSGDKRRHGLRILESWLARRALTRLTTKNYNRFVPRLIAHVRRDPTNADRAIFTALAGGEGDISRWPEDKEFISFLTERDIYGTVSQARLSMAIGAVEESLYSAKTDIVGLPASLTLEHLMPQEWEAHWPLVDEAGNTLTGEAEEAAHARRLTYIHRLGNLTVVTQPLNTSLSNSAWDAKRKVLNGESRLLLNARVGEQATWDEGQIEARGQWLAECMLEIWPGPNAAAWGFA